MDFLLCFDETSEAVAFLFALDMEDIQSDSTKEGTVIQQLRKHLADERMKKEQVRMVSCLFSCH